MAVKTHWWITAWYLITIPIIIWDASYCLMRPRSMKGGDLHWIWKPYSIYQEVDHVYGVQALEEGDGFTNAQAVMNIIETVLNAVYVYLAHVAEWPGAPVIGFSSALMTLAKTLLYWGQEYFCGYCAIGHNKLGDLILYWILPNGLWIVIPGKIVWTMGRDMAESLGIASKASGSRGAHANKKAD